jgi:uncharacterized protein with FMN-binding domain
MTDPWSAPMDSALADRVAGLRKGRSHPSQGARSIALLASLASTVSVAAALGYVDRGSSAPTATSAAAGPATTGTTGTTGSASATGSTATAAKYADGTWTGSAEYTEWGDLQVRVTVSGGRIVDVTAVQTPGGPKSARINAVAQPILEAEAVAAQGAHLDMVSGATYTSRTYTASLQAALDQAAAKADRSTRTS